MKPLLVSLLCLLFLKASANESDSTLAVMDSLESTFKYQHGEIKFENNIGTLNVPPGFRYLDAKQTEYVIHDLWGNPGGAGTLGMILPEEIGITEGAWAFIITYEEMGYVKDDDADDIDYDEMLEQLQTDAVEDNKEREKAGYQPITIVGWAAKPYYDKSKNVLHWAKEIKFGDAEESTLNYNVRVLGRKGVLVLNAVASMPELPQVEENIDPVLSSFSYGEGNKYSDFDPDIDEVAAWTIGGLVAGKVLAKVGLLALLLKNIKLVGLAIVGAFAAVRKWFKKKIDPPTVRELGGEPEPPADSTPV